MLAGRCTCEQEPCYIGTNDQQYKTHSSHKKQQSRPNAGVQNLKLLQRNNHRFPILVPVPIVLPEVTEKGCHLCLGFLGRHSEVETPKNIEQPRLPTLRAQL